MRALWLDFKKDAQLKFREAGRQDKDSLRRMFHSLSSSSKVFGMDDFARFCSKAEDEILKGNAQKGSEFLLPGAKLLEQQLAEIEDFFNKDKP